MSFYHCHSRDRLLAGVGCLVSLLSSFPTLLYFSYGLLFLLEGGCKDKRIDFSITDGDGRGGYRRQLLYERFPPEWAGGVEKRDTLEYCARVLVTVILFCFALFCYAFCLLLRSLVGTRVVRARGRGGL